MTSNQLSCRDQCSALFGTTRSIIMAASDGKGPVDLAAARERMITRDIAGRGICDGRVLAAMREVAREAFVSESLREFAYDDTPLPIGSGQTISQPYVVAFMIEALQLNGGEKVLEIGTGSGYAAAVLAEIAGEVTTVERLHPLADRAADIFARLGYRHIHVQRADGTLGWPARAPYDAIVVTAGGPQVPEALKQQLAIGGRLVIPVGAGQDSQELVRVTRRSAAQFDIEEIGGVRFVPLIGEQGWPAGA
jgi:protein-L-isoaspartate(D-aspartate) O-methyltransferase